MTPDQLLDEFVDLMAPRLEKRGFVRTTPPQPTPAPSKRAYDQAMCARFFDENHIGNNVLNRAELFFGELDRHGEIGSLDLAALLGLRSPKSIPANLTIALKKSAARLGVRQPWRGDASSDNRTIWRDYDGIAVQMVRAIDAEQRRRGLKP